MKYFQEVALLRDARIDLYDFWQIAFQQIHIALADNKNDDGGSSVGVSFPEYDAGAYLLGTKLRLFAHSSEELEKLQCERWLQRLQDYLHISNIRDVPDHVDGYACFRQLKPKGSLEKQARRRAKRKGETLQQALAHFENYQEERSKLPYIHMTSLSNGHRFRLFIDKFIVESSHTGTFNCYGLSRQATVPLF